MQRGSGQLSKNSNITNMTISISAVNLEKSALIITFMGQFTTATTQYATAFAALTASNEITITYYCPSPNKLGQTGYTWTVIEFY